MTQFLTTPHWALPFAVVIGLCIGSFLNVVVYRLPKMMEREWQAQCRALLSVATGTEPLETLTLSKPGSTCPHCGHRIRAWENIPVFSYLWLRGKCAQCRKPIALRYPLVELATGAATLVTLLLLGLTPAGGLALLLVWSLIALTLIDYDTQLLPDTITLPLLWLGLLVNQWGLLTDAASALWGAVFGYLSLWLVYHAFRLTTGKEGMGYGDFKLLAALGAWLGWQMLPAIILLSSLVGALVGISLIVFGKNQRGTPIPFGPYLAAAGLLTLWWGQSLTTAWYGFLGVGI